MTIPYTLPTMKTNDVRYLRKLIDRLISLHEAWMDVENDPRTNLSVNWLQSFLKAKDYDERIEAFAGGFVQYAGITPMRRPNGRLMESTYVESARRFHEKHGELISEIVLGLHHV